MTQLTDVRARDLMRTNVVTLTADATIREAVETLQDDHLGGVPVLDDAEKVVGFLSLADIVRATDRHKGRTTREVAPEEVALTLADICAAPTREMNPAAPPLF